jgi:hypothetical protein
LTLPAELDSNAHDLFEALNRSTKGDREAQASMYALGEAIGLDRDDAAKAAEDLIALGLVEIRTLSGGIGLSEAGAEALSSDQDPAGQTPRLGSDSPLDSDHCEQVERLLARIKSELSSSGLVYETLAEMMADIRTIEAQLASSRPKTPIIRECLVSLRDAAAADRQEAWRQLVAAFID